jgi:hypothetical protein
MKSLKVSLVLVGVFVSFNVFAAGECAGNANFKAVCGHVKSVMEAVECIRNNAGKIGGKCEEKNKKVDAMCTEVEIRACEEDVTGLDFEKCLSESSNDGCKAVIKSYLN